eukprot:33529_1
MATTKLTLLLLICLLIFTSSQNTQLSMSEKIQHIVVLMLENRSFDHMLGFMKVNRSDIDGCTPNGNECCNPMDPFASRIKTVCATNDAPYESNGDPPHEVINVTEQIFGTSAYGNNIAEQPAPMNGFINSYSSVYGDGSEIMKLFDAKTAPILNTLANEFGVIDAWFSSIPGPTTPNRLMAMRGHTNGTAGMDPGSGAFAKDFLGYPGLDIFGMIDQYSINKSYTWNVFAGDTPNVLFLDYPRNYPEKFYPMDDFYVKTMHGTLPFLSWIEPSFFEINCMHRAQDQHPDHDTNIGEWLIKNIYESLRVSPHWNSTLFFIYYDEHGGFYDHVSPPSAPNPDGQESVDIEPPFNFERLGVRVPAVLVSPFVKKGTKNSIRPADGESQYCHTSLIHTIRNEYTLNSPALSVREDWSLTFEDLINLNEPRTDCPLILPELGECTYQHNCWQPVGNSNKSLNSLQKVLVKVVCGVAMQFDEKFINYDESMVGEIANNCFQKWRTVECALEEDTVIIMIVICSVGSFIVGIILMICGYYCWKKCCRKRDDHRSAVSDSSDSDSD